MSRQLHTLCDCCGTYTSCTPWQLGLQRHFIQRARLGGHSYKKQDNLPPASPKLQEVWLCFRCIGPGIQQGGVLPTCVHCGLPLRPAEYRAELCAVHQGTRPGMEAVAALSHLRRQAARGRA